MKTALQAQTRTALPRIPKGPDAASKIKWPQVFLDMFKSFIYLTEFDISFTIYF